MWGHSAAASQGARGAGEVSQREASAASGQPAGPPRTAPPPRSRPRRGACHRLGAHHAAPRGCPSRAQLRGSRGAKCTSRCRRSRASTRAPLASPGAAAAHSAPSSSAFAHHVAASRNASHRAAAAPQSAACPACGSPAARRCPPQPRRARAAARAAARSAALAADEEPPRGACGRLGGRPWRARQAARAQGGL